ncbi:MAG: hypothetical protein ACPGR8_01170 [Limisphaerales bacterium]
MSNKNYTLELANFKRGLIPGTPQHSARMAYPGVMTNSPCDNAECVNFKGELRIESYWLCPGCEGKSPDVVRTHYTHAPSSNAQSKTKIVAANASAFRAYCILKRWQQTR